MWTPLLLAPPVAPGPLLIVAELALLVAISEVLAQRTFLRHFGSALLVIVLTALAANIPWVPVPVYGEDGGVYGEISSTVAPLGVFWLLLGVDLRQVFQAGRNILVVFIVGSLGVFFGVGLAMVAVSGATRFGEHAAALGGMFVGTYVGGSANFNAVALAYDVQQDAPTLYAGATVVDATATALWMMACVAIPRWLSRGKAGSGGDSSGPQAIETPSVEELTTADEETVTPLELAVLLALGGFALLGSEALSAWLEAVTQLKIASMLLLSTLALILAQLPWVRGLRGPRALGMLTVLIFLASIGALCDVGALVELAELGPVLIAFVAVILVVHGTITFLVAKLLRVDPVVAAVASQANIAGGTSALALARSFGRSDLVLPSILIGALGTALGNFLGFGMASWLAS